MIANGYEVSQWGDECVLKLTVEEFPLWLSGNEPVASMRMQVRSLASLSGLRTQCCRELWCRLQMQLRLHVAVAVV